jgi:aminoglycoside phosphotransferase (APT) family kinase protein
MSTEFGVGGNRIGWADLPERVRAALTARLGADVESEASQPGGFSPGLAARFRLTDGRRVFVKAVGLQRNPGTPGMHRREIEILRALPPDLPVPRLLDSYDDGDWVALVIEDVEGTSPAMPWRTEEFAEVVTALTALSKRLTPSPIQVASVDQAHPELFGNWRTVAENDVHRLPGWAADHLGLLVELEADAVEAVRGDTLLHLDLRADNMLRTDAGVVFVDWPHACLGAPWFDLVGLLPSVGMQGGPDPETVWQQAVGSSAEPDRVNAALAAVAGFFLVGSLQPAPPNLPTLRTFQRMQGDVTLDWLRGRLPI